MNSNKKLNASLLITFIGACLHLYLTQQHYDLKYGTATGESLCNISDVFNCTAVAASSWSTFLGLPLAVLGFLSHFVLFIYVAIVRLKWTETQEVIESHTLLLSLLIGAASIVMMIISLTQMNVYCLFCILTYITSFANVALLYSSQAAQRLLDPATYTSFFTQTKWSLILFLAIPVGSFAFDKSSAKQNGFTHADQIVNSKIQGWTIAQAYTFDEQLGLSLVQQVNSSMTLVEFADFMCSHCKHASSTIKAFVKSHPDVKFIFKSYPLDGACNPQIQGSAPGAIRCESAALTICSEKLNKNGWSTHDWLFENQENLFNMKSQTDLLSAYKKDFDVDTTQLAQCMDSQETKDALRAMANEGAQAQIRGTPTFFVNGKLLEGAQVLPVLNAVYSKVKQ